MNIKILQQNICKNNKKVKELMDSLLVNEPQVIFFSEFGYSKHKNEIIKRLEEREKYHIEMPLAFVEKRDKNKPCSCMMAVKDGIDFIPRKREGISLSLRYIEGELSFENGILIEALFVYVPQTFSGNKDRVEQKDEMLFETYRFWNEYKNKNVFIGGDFNTETNGTTRGENIFKATYNDMNDTDTHEPTWKDKCLDYALVSDSLLRNGCKTSRLKTSSDHIALLTEIAI